TAGIPVGSPQRTHEMMPRMRATLALSAVITGGRVRTAGMLCPGGTGATPGGGGTSPAGAKEYPQLLQNLDPGTFATPHFAQVIVPPRCGVLADRDPSFPWAVETPACPAPWAKCLAKSHRRAAKISARPLSPR